uniref:Predicted ORF n=1 Tax=Mycobacterium tuberculosis TaxID=1773 RepID=P95304_MYCTX|nr:unnamed protein product [Mycobacterium tuberculosis H37Rv]
MTSHASQPLTAWCPTTSDTPVRVGINCRNQRYRDPAPHAALPHVSQAPAAGRLTGRGGVADKRAAVPGTGRAAKPAPPG